MKNAELTEGTADTATAVAETPVSPEERQNLALHTIKNHTITAMGIGILPVPGVDLLALTGVQLNLLRKVGALYGFKLTDEKGKKLLGALLSGYLPLAIAAPVASLLKFIPGVGMAAGALSQSTLAGATTYAVGKLFLQHFESGGDFLDFKPSEMGKKLREQVEEGKDFIKKHVPGRKAENA